MGSVIPTNKYSSGISSRRCLPIPFNTILKSEKTALEDYNHDCLVDIEIKTIKGLPDSRHGIQKLILSQSGRSLKWTVPRKWTVLGQSGRSFEPKWTTPLKNIELVDTRLVYATIVSNKQRSSDRVCPTRWS